MEICPGATLSGRSPCRPSAGNICGGTFIFALLSHAQIRNDMSSKRKAEARAQAAEKGKKADRA